MSELGPFFQKQLSCDPFKKKFEGELVDKGQLQSGHVVKGVVNYLIFLFVVGGANQISVNKAFIRPVCIFVVHN